MNELIEIMKPQFTGRPTVSSAQHWLDTHGMEFDKFLQEVYTEEGIQDAVRKFYIEDPFLGIEKTIDHCTPNFIKIEFLKQQLLSLDFGMQILFLGQPQSGKTALMFTLAEWLYRGGRPVAWLGPPAVLPDFISKVTVDIDEIEPGYVILCDEGAVKFGHREAMTKDNREFFKKLPTISHQDDTLLFYCTQSLKLTDTYAKHLYQVLFCKRMTSAQIKGERSIIKELSEWIPNPTAPKGLTYVRFEIDPHIQFTIEISLPSWWDKRYSKPYRKLEEDAAISYARQLLALYGDRDNPLRLIQRELKAMRVNKPLDYWRETLGIET
ncbi:MAG: hypothetical protein AYK18_07065 [Theionarchaea archaeon DG-70]|nr:MAG: hypothetical protein AYK18_07065 [Theionarchaea archaeon DG-70]